MTCTATAITAKQASHTHNHRLLKSQKYLKVPVNDDDVVSHIPLFLPAFFQLPPVLEPAFPSRHSQSLSPFSPHDLRFGKRKIIVSLMCVCMSFAATFRRCLSCEALDLASSIPHELSAAKLTPFLPLVKRLSPGITVDARLQYLTS